MVLEHLLEKRLRSGKNANEQNINYQVTLIIGRHSQISGPPMDKFPC